jgi:hypothetical protein
MEALDRPAWSPARQCTATNRAGERCQRQPIPGGHVCVMHGGAIPQVQRSARMRLLEGADLAIDYLLKLLEPRTPCVHCGRSDADRDPVVVRACQLVLDRSGFHPTLTIQQEQPPPDRYAGLSDDALVEEIQQLLDAAIEQRDLHRRASLPAAIDGTVLDEGFEIPDDVEPEAAGTDPPGDWHPNEEDAE